MKTKVYVQGDVIIRKRCPKIKAKRSEKNILAYGEATGHYHYVEGKFVLFGEPSDEIQKLTVHKSGAKVMHYAPETQTGEEHKPIILDEGDYEITKQREYWDGMIRTVAD